MNLDVGDRIFVSSTISDLRDFREAAYRAIRRIGLVPILLEKEWGPIGRKGRRRDVARQAVKEVHKSKAFISILGGKKGSYIPRTNIRLVENEVFAAEEANIPIFTYVTPQSRLFKRLEGGVENNFDLIMLSGSEIVEPASSPIELQTRLKTDLSQHIQTKEVISSRESIIIAPVSPKYWTTLVNNRTELLKCSPRFFEEIVAELLRADGWDVELVIRNNAPGPDIIAFSSNIIDSVPIKMIVECKRYRENKPVDIAALRNLVYWVNEEYKATLGMIVTTSRFTFDARKLVEEKHRWRITLKDQGDVVEWMKKYSSFSGLGN